MTSIFMHGIERLVLEPVQKQSTETHVRTLRIESATEADITLDLFAKTPAALEIVESPRGKEFAWLIEAGDPPHYWDGRTPSGYTNDPNEAIRFARFEDAEKVRLHLIAGGVHWKSVQHGFTRAGTKTRADLSAARPEPVSAERTESGRLVPPVPGEPSVSGETTHRYMPRAKVWVLNRYPGGRWFVDGEAEICNADANLPDRYRIRFLEEFGGPSVIRHIDPAAQGSRERAQARADELNAQGAARNAAQETAS